MVNRNYRPLQMHRIAYTDLTEAQVADIIKPTVNVDVQVVTPIVGNSTLAQMARLQGLFGNLRWEAGRLEARHEKERGQWQMTELRYVAA